MNYRLKTMEEMDACVFSSDMLYNDEERKHFEAMVARWVRALSETENTAPPQPEPVATLFGSLPVYDVPPKQEPVAWELNEVILNSIRDSSEVVSPPQREWQGLTDEDISKAYDDARKALNYKSPCHVDIARAIEAKLREKNT